jgi:aspartate-semialdehyde dehydrogenase
MSEYYNVGVVGATGAVGNEMINILEERDFPVKELRLYASERSEGKIIRFKGENIKVERLSKNSFNNLDIALFSAGASRSLEFAPIAADSGTVVIDNSSAFRMDPDIPLIVPEVNPEAIGKYRNRGIISNPNCSTIQMVVVLKPIHDFARIKRVVVTTFQSVSGTGKKAIDELLQQSRAILEYKEVRKYVYPHQIAFNCLPHIDSFLDNGYTKEEIKMVNETKKIMDDDSIKVTATTVRVPVLYCHSESVNIETERKIEVKDAKNILSEADGIVVYDDPYNNIYPLAADVVGKDDTYVGRIRKDESIDNGLNLWIVADNLRKGAALNAIQIAEILVDRYL